jgi:hypothetical protein
MSYIHTVIQTVYLGIGLHFLNNIPWPILFLFLEPYNIKYYTLTKKEECKRIQKKITWWSQQTDNEKGCGYSIGYWYWINLKITSGDEEQYTILMIATESSYKKLIKENDIILNKSIDNNNKVQVISTIDIYDRLGSYHNIWFKKRTMKIPQIKPRINQQKILDSINEQYKNNNSAVIFLHGNPGCGKSRMGLFLSEHYKGSYCNNLTPWQPGDTLTNLYSEVDPTEDKPLIVALEEIDIPLIKIHNNQIESHKNLPVLIKDKTGWNHFFDTINRGLFPNLILLMTSNKSPEYVNQLDSSYLRKGRVDLIFELTEDQEKNHDLF